MESPKPTVFNRLKAGVRAIGRDLREVGVCVMLGLKDSLRWQLFWRGVLMAAVVSLFWLVWFVVWREPIWHLSRLVGGSGVAVYLYPFMPHAPATNSNMALNGYILLFAAAVVLLAPVAAVLLILVSYVGLVLLCFRWWALRALLARVVTVARRRYAPSWRPDTIYPGLSWLQHLRLLLTAVLGTVICLVLPITGGLFLLMWVGYLATRSLAIRGMSGDAPAGLILSLFRESRLPLTLLGSLFTVALLVPVLGLIAPTAMASATTHLMLRAHRRYELGSSTSAELAAAVRPANGAPPDDQ